MRMWMVPPEIMCNQHLLGEHCELHMFVGALRMGTRIDGYIRNDLLELHSIFSRHEELVKELERRGMCHKSPLILPEEIVERLSEEYRSHTINRAEALAELIKRCKNCRRNYIKFLNERKEMR